MLHKIIGELEKLPWQTEFNRKDWLNLTQEYTSLDFTKRKSFVSAVALHCGISEIQLDGAFRSLSMKSEHEHEHEHEHEQIIKDLNQTEQQITSKITTFQNSHSLQSFDLTPLVITRTEWNKIIVQFDREQRKSTSLGFLINYLSQLRQVVTATLYDMLVDRSQPKRTATKRNYGENLDSSPIKKYHTFFKRDAGLNSLIYHVNNENDPLQSQLEDAGVRITELTPVTPVKNQPRLMRTPGKTLTRPLCTIDGLTLFKHLTPFRPKTDREDVRAASKALIIKKLPRLNFDRAVPVEFSATLPSILLRSKTPRSRSQKGIMGASASDVFRAHGIEITSINNCAYHWSHLIAHFFADTQEITTADPEKEKINLVPATAAANYNILEAIELYIKKKLEEKATEEIIISVEPQYSGESLVPDLLIYTLRWSEINHDGHLKEHEETFNISAQSHQRFTKSMYRSFALLREFNVIPPEETKDEDDTTLVPHQH